MVIALISVNITLVVTCICMDARKLASFAIQNRENIYHQYHFIRLVLIHSIAIGTDVTAVTEASLYSQNFIICSKESFKLSFGTYFSDPGVIYVRKYATELETSINVLRNKDHRFAEL